MKSSAAIAGFGAGSDEVVSRGGGALVAPLDPIMNADKEFADDLFEMIPLSREPRGAIIRRHSLDS